MDVARQAIKERQRVSWATSRSLLGFLLIHHLQEETFYTDLVEQSSTRRLHDQDHPLPSMPPIQSGAAA